MMTSSLVERQNRGKGVGRRSAPSSSGIDAVVLYSPRIFETARISSSNLKLLATIAVGFVKIAFILVATFLVEWVGRRPLSLNSMIGMIFSNSHSKLISAIVLCIASVLAYVASFSIGMGPITWVHCSEIIPPRPRAQGCSIKPVVWIASLVWVYFYLTLSKKQGKTSRR